MANVKCNTLSDIYRPLLNAKLEEGWNVFENFVNEYFETDVVRQIMDEYNNGGVGNDSTITPLETPVEETKARIDRSGEIPKSDVNTTLYYSDSSKQSLMERNFTISMISKCIVDPESLLRGEDTTINSEHVGNTIYEYKKSLFNTIYDFIKIHGFEEDIDIESIMNPLDREVTFKKVLNYFSSNCVQTLKDDGSYDSVYEAFAILSIFDKLVERYAPYIEIDKRYKSPYSEEYYKYVGSKANHFQHVFGKDEYMDASDSMGELPKILLNSLPLVTLNGKEWELVKDSSIGENAFHNIGSKLKQAIDGNKLVIRDLEDSSIPINVTDLLNNEVELTKRMPDVIDAFYDFITGSKSFAEEKTSLLDQLRAIQKLIFSESMPLEIRLIFTHNILKQVPSTYVSYSDGTVDFGNEKVTGICPTNLTERLITLEKYVLDEKIKAQSKYWIDNISRFEEIFKNLNISLENTIDGFKLKYTDSKSNSVQLRFIRSDNNIWIYHDEIVKDGKNGESYKNTRDLRNRINTLWESIMYDKISSEFKKIFNNRKSADLDPILAHIPLLATVIDNVLKYNKEKGGNFKTCDFGSVKEIARTKAIISGADLKNVIKNGDGNNLPLYQMLCLAYRHTELYQKVKKEIDSEGIGALQHNIAFNNISSILYPKIRTEVTVRNGISSKTVNVTKLSQQDITHLAVGYDFLLPLFSNQNSVEDQSSNKCILGFQTHCFSDKNKHFIMQFDITRPWNINGTWFNLKQILINFVRGKNVDKFKELKSAWRNSSKLQYSEQIVNILNEYKLVFGAELNLDLYNKSIKENVDTLINFLRTNNLKYKNVVSKFEKAGVDFRNEITGCKSKDGYLEFNETLVALYETFSDEKKFDKFYSTNLKKFINESQGAKNTITSDGLFKKLQEVNGIDFDKVWEAYYLMDTMFSTEYNKMMIGDVYMHPNKLKDSVIENGAINNFAKSKNKTPEEIKVEIENDSKLKSEFEDFKQNLKTTYSLANRWVTQVKRMVIFGATYHSYCTGMKEGIPEEVNIAIVEDMPDSVRNIAGVENSGLDSMDGSGFTSPYLSIMQNKSLLDAAVGKSKKTIYHDLGGKFGDPLLLKWAEYELTTTLRRNSWASTVSAEKVFKKMHNRKFDPNVSIQYTKRFENPLIIEDPYTHNEQRVYEIKIDGRIGYRLNEQGNIITTFEINSIYDIDQLFGGAWVKRTNNGETTYSEDAIKETYEIICENNLKNYMIGILANKSAVKVGTRNLNSVERWTNDEDFWTSKMTLNFGGLQMNADHELDDAEVTEMTQMISAIEQLGNTHNISTMVYEEIGKYCAASLKEITEALSKTDFKEKKDALYQIYGKALIKAFNSGNKDTLGLAQSFIKAAQQSINEYKITYQIPLSSASINGIFNSTVTSDIIKKAIRRHYDGIASVLHPGFNIMQYYTIDGLNYRFEELAKVVDGDLKYLIESIDPNTNKYIVPITNDNPVDFQDTIVIVDSLNETAEVVTIDSYEKYLKYRNVYIPNKTIYRHTLRPKNLKGSDTIFAASVYSKDGSSVENQIMSVFETPESILLHFMNKFGINNFKQGIKSFKSKLNSILENNSELISKYESLCNEIEKENNPKRVLKKRLENFLKTISNIPSEGIKHENIVITESKVIPAQIAMGKLYAKQLGLKSTDSVADVLKNGTKFFEKRFYNQTNIENNDSHSFDACLFREDGTPLYVKIGQFKGDLKEISSRIKQVPGEYQNIDGQIWVGDKQICSADNKQFVKYLDSEGNEFDMCIVNDISSFENLKKSGLFEQIDYNFRIDNYEKLIDFRLKDLHKENGQYEYRSNLNFNLIYDGKNIIKSEGLEKNKRGNVYTDFDILKQHIKTHDEKELFVQVLRTMNYNTLKHQNKILANKRFEAFQKSLRFVGTRIPCQSMQSFAPMEIVMFTDSDVNEVYVPTMVCWLQGSDYDIDKQYLLGYSLSDNGTFSQSQSEWNKENLLKNKVVDGIFDVILSPSNQISLTMPVDTESIKSLAEKSSAREAANRMTPYCPSSKFRMQIENMVGKTCIGNVATSIKSFFALSNLYNQRIDEAIVLISNGDFETAKLYLKIYGLSLANVNTDKLRLISTVDEELNQLISQVIEYQNNFDDVSMTLGELLNCATDNAKELVLKKINADNKWIDIYCVQLMLGEDVNSIGSFMMDPDIINLINEYDSSIFGEEQISQSLFVENKIKSFTQSIKRLEDILDDLKNNPRVSSAKIKSWINNYKEKNLPKFKEWSSKLDLENNFYHNIPSEILNEMYNLFTKEYDEIVSIWNRVRPKYDKLSKYLNSTKEIQTLGKMLKINQGLETKFSDQLLRIYNIQKYVRSKYRDAKHDENLQKLIVSFDIYKFIDDIEYQQQMIKAYEVVKSNFNILEVIATVPHFKEMFKTVSINKDVLCTSALRNKLIFEAFSNPEIDLNSETAGSIVESVTNQINDEWLYSQQIQFPIPKGMEFIDGGGNKQVSIGNVKRTLSNQIEKRNFKAFVENVVIPLLKEQYPENSFVSNLEFGIKDLKFDSSGIDEVYLKLNINMMSVDNSVKNRSEYDEILKGFNDLQYSVFKFNGYSYNVVDLIFIYNLIVNKDRFGQTSFTRLFEDIINNDPEGRLYISKFNRWLDDQNPDNFNLKIDHALKTYAHLIPELNDIDFESEVPNLTYDKDDSESSEIDKFLLRLNLLANKDMGQWIESNKLNLDKFYSMEIKMVDTTFADHILTVNSVEPYLNGQKLILASNKKQLDMLSKIPAGKDIIIELRDFEGNSINVRVVKELGRLVSDKDLKIFGLRRKEFSLEESQQRANDFKMYSGGAIGSDLMWDEIAREFGITKIKHYTTDDYDNSLKIEGAEEEIEKAYIQSAKALGKNPSPKTKYVGKLVRRDYLQAKSADAIYAITGFESRNNKLVPMGGTAYAIMMGIDLGKEIYIWDIYENVWKTYDYKSKEFVQYKDGKTPPPLKHKFAGIGTRDIDPKRGKNWVGENVRNSARSAMESLFEYNGFKKIVPNDVILKHESLRTQLEEDMRAENETGNYYNDNMDSFEFDSKSTLETIESSFTEESKTKIQLNDEQENAVNKAISIIQSETKKELLIQGKAGTGKTTLVNAIIEQFPDLKISILTPTNKAKNNIKKKVDGDVGFNTVASFLGNRIDVFGDIEEGSSKIHPNIIIIDEVSMLSDEDRDKILKEHPYASIIYLGDEGQLPPVGKKPSAVFSSEDVERVNLTTRVRQGEESPILPLTDPFWNYSVNKETGPLPELKVKNTINSKGAVINSKAGSKNIVPKLMNSFIKSIEDNNPDFVKIVAGTNNAVDSYNKTIKENLLELGYFKKIDNFDFSPGEMLIFNTPYQIGESEWIKNSEEFKIQSISEEFEMNVNDKFGTKFLIDPVIKYRNVSILVSGREIIIPVISSDGKNIFEKHRSVILNNKQKGIKDGLKEGMSYLQHFANVNQIYAITAHKAQGSTYEICALDVSNITGVRQDFWSNEDKAKCIYTGMTRPSNVLILLSNGSGDFDGDILDINNKINQNKSQKPIQNKTKSNEPVQFEGKMTYSYGSSKRSDVKSETTIEAIRNRERTATTRYNSDGNIDYWKQAKVGDIIRFEGKNKGDYVLVRVIKPLTKLDPNTSKEEWSRKEGWSEEYFDKKVKPKLNQAWQIEFEYVGSNPVQLELFSDNTYSIDSNPRTPELPKSTKLIRMVETLNNSYIKLVHDEDLVNESVTVQNSKGFVRNGIVYINLDRMNAGSTLIHELGHLYLGGLKAKFGPNTSAIPEEVKEYYKILEELKTLPLWKQLRNVEEYSDKYGSDFNEEIATRLIEQYFNGNLSTYKEEQIAKKLLSLLDKEFRDLVENASSTQFVDNLMGFSENYEVQQKISSLKRRLYQDGSIKETDC